MTQKNSIINKEEAGLLLSGLGEEFAVIPNPSYVHPDFEVVPLAPKLTRAPEPLLAVVMDMDGTTTTTEELCIHSLEYMIRRVSGRMTKEEWAGLDHERDYPHIIGNSTTKHIEYLVSTYGALIDEKRMRSAFIFAALWTLILGRDERRRNEVMNNCKNLGLGRMCDDPRLGAPMPASDAAAPGDAVRALADELCDAYGRELRLGTAAERVRASIDIYYQRYHEILLQIQSGRGEDVARTVLGDPAKHLIEPMPGIGVALAMMKGWLGAESVRFADMLADELRMKGGAGMSAEALDDARRELGALGAHFAAHPLKVAVVTSSIFYEADIVMTEVCRVIRTQIDRWPVSADRRAMLREKFSSYRHLYDAFVTASDSSEIRLKPHRDLYSMALHALGIPKAAFGRVAGFEDSESGTISIRAAGIGLCVAVPFEHSKGHNLEAASFVLPGGVPEALLAHRLFMPAL